jgi:hypothetical protein
VVVLCSPLPVGTRDVQFQLTKAAAVLPDVDIFTAGRATVVLGCRDHAEVMRWVERATNSLRQHGAKRVDIEHALGGTFLPAEVAGPSNTGAGHAA